MDRDVLLSKFSEKIPVGSDGHIQLIDVMGDEQAIVDAARVSYGRGTKRASEDRHLLRYLMRHQHWTPFEMCEIKLRVRIPMDIWRQMIRHRTASVNEYSTRYSVAIDSMATTEPENWRLQALDNKQGSLGFLEEWPETVKIREEATSDNPQGAWVNGGSYFCSPGDYLSTREKELQEFATQVYNERLLFGIAREQARKDLPLSTYTEAIWKIDLRNLLNYLKLRLDNHAQLEIREFAEAIARIVQEWVPNVWEAFEDYHLDSLTLNSQDITLVQMIVETGAQSAVDFLYESHWVRMSPEKGVVKSRELQEFEKKMDILSIKLDWTLER